MELPVCVCFYVVCVHRSQNNLRDNVKKEKIKIKTEIVHIEKVTTIREDKTLKWGKTARTKKKES